MGVTLFDLKTDEVVFDVNFWHWRAIVEVVRRLGVIAEERVDLLHEPFVGELDEAEARAAGRAVRERVLPTLLPHERVLLDGTRTLEPDDGTLYRDPREQHRNYSTDGEVLSRFAQACESCGGFRVG